MKVLFFLHGMGAHDPGWADAAVAQLDELAGLYPETWDLRPLRRRLTVEPIAYDRVLRGPVEPLKASPETLQDFLRRNGEEAPEVSTWLGQASRLEQEYFWAQVIDLLLYRFVPDIRRTVRTLVQRQIAERLSAHLAQREPVEATVFAYGLGTAVGHEALAQLASQDLDGSRALRAGNFRFENIITIAHLGKILETDEKIYGSPVRPVTPSGPPGYCRRYLNFRNVFDPFPLPEAFDPGWETSDFISVEQLGHIHRFNLHALDHYLDHPAVHIPILHALFGPRISAATKERSLKDYDPFPFTTRCHAVFQAFRARLDVLLQDLENDPRPARLVTTGASFLAAANQAEDACL